MCIPLSIVMPMQQVGFNYDIFLPEGSNTVVCPQATPLDSVCLLP